jgi:hypothetical protein
MMALCPPPTVPLAVPPNLALGPEESRTLQTMGTQEV